MNTNTKHRSTTRAHARAHTFVGNAKSNGNHYANALKAKIHIGKTQLGLDDATYRDVLVRVTGKNSCALMNDIELVAVANELKRLGFVPSAPRKGKRPTAAKSRTALLGKIEAILSDLALPWNYAHATAKAMFGVEFAHWLAPDKLYKLTQALAVYQKRQNAKSAKHTSNT